MLNWIIGFYTPSDAFFLIFEVHWFFMFMLHPKSFPLFLLCFMLFSAFNLPTHLRYLLKSEEHGYQIEFPSLPMDNHPSVNSPFGELKMHVFLYDASMVNKKDENQMYLLNLTIYPPQGEIHSNRGENISEFYRSTIDGIIKQNRGTILTQKEIEINNYPGKEFKLEIKNGKAILTGRLFLIENKMFLIQTIADKKKEGNQAQQKFFESFLLL